MQAAVLHDFGKALSIEDVPLPAPGPGEALLRVTACGVCHSDLHVVDGDWPRLKPVTRIPLIPGHEVVGVVEKLGDGVTELAVGQRGGVPWLHWACGTCEYCAAGRETLCSKQAITGVTVNGGFATHMLAKASHVARVPNSVSDVDAAPLLCAGVTVYKALKSAGLEAGQQAVIYGVGGLGHLAIQVARAKGAEVAAVDLAEDKLALARESGATWTGTAKPPRGHVVLVAAGSAKAYEAAFASMRKGGTLVVVGMPPEPVPLSAFHMVSGEYRVIGSAVGTREDLRETLELAARGLLRSHVATAPLVEAPSILEKLRAGSITGRVVLVNA
ncbi:MAG: zinc-dependent alcohol dehydrogenase [Bryobacteraceae bacterium]